MTDRLVNDPRFKNIYWRNPREGRTTVIFLGPKGAEAFKSLMETKSQLVEKGSPRSHDGDLPAKTEGNLAAEEEVEHSTTSDEGGRT